MPRVARGSNLAFRVDFPPQIHRVRIFCGGQADVEDEQVEKLIREEYDIKRSDVIRRHGIKPERAIMEVLDRKLYATVENRIKELGEKSFQTSDLRWNGGYWDQRSEKLTSVDVDDTTKRGWRVEYVPPATELLASGLVAAIAGYLDSSGECGSDFRVTLHRTLVIGTDAWLQQLTEYMGSSKREGRKGRTFPIDHGTIGLAAVKRRIARTRVKLPTEEDANYRSGSQDDMQALRLDTYAQRMNQEVRSVIAVPMLDGKREYPIAVLFADSTEPDVFTGDRIRTIVKICQTFCSQLKYIGAGKLWNFQVTVKLNRELSPQQLKVIETLEEPKPPFAEDVKYLNVEFTDFIVAEKASEGV